jgi:hypothetical protein
MSLETSSTFPSTSSSIPSTTLPIRYFDTLPHELLISIIVDAARKGIGRRNPFGKDDTTLRSLCLTSKLFRSLAQPLLLGTFAMTHRQDSKKVLGLLLEHNSLENLGMIRKVYLDQQYFDVSFLGYLARLVEGATDLLDFSCYQVYSHLQPFIGMSEFFSDFLSADCHELKFSEPDLVTLSLSGIPFPEDAVFSYPRVVNMFLFVCEFTGGGPHFDLPSLRHLVYSPSNHPIPDHELRLLDTVASNLISLTCDLHVAPLLPNSITSNPLISTIHDVESFANPLDWTDITNVKYLRFWYDRPCDEYRPTVYQVEQLKICTKLVNDAPTLETLILHPGKTNFILDYSHRDAMNDLLDVCDRRGIGVIWEERADLWNFSEESSPSFIKLAEDRRAAFLAKGTS